LRETSPTPHAVHIRDEQEHLTWSADHMRALAVIRKIEARIYAAEVEILEHRAEIMRHEEALDHGGADAALSREHDSMEHRHKAARSEHRRLLAAIHALEEHLKPEPRPA
jgi:predicted  nucleic acid-binding Zn-ribbon protein